MSADRANKIAVVGLMCGLMLQLLTGAYFYGRLSERVDAIDRNTQILLQHTLRTEERAER